MSSDRGRNEPWKAVQASTLAELFEWYDERYPGLEMGAGARPAIVVIDFSIGFTRGSAEFSAGQYPDEVRATRRLLDAARGRIPVYFTTIAYDPDMKDAGLWFCKLARINALQKGSREVEIDEDLAPQADEPLIVKKYPSAFYGTGFEAMLRRDNVDTLIITGCTTSSCVRATTVDSMQRGFRTLLAADAISDITPLLHAIHLRDLGARYADVKNVDELVTYVGSVGDWGWRSAGRAAEIAALAPERDLS